MKLSKLFVCLWGCILLSNGSGWTDPSHHSGVWVMDADRSSWSDGTMPEGMALSISLSFQDGQVIYSSTNSTCLLPQYSELEPCQNPIMRPYGVSYSAPLDETHVGAENPTGHYDTISVRKFNVDEYQVLKLKDGDIITAEFWFFRPGGNEFVRRGYATASGHTYDEYFTRGSQ